MSYVFLLLIELYEILWLLRINHKHKYYSKVLNHLYFKLTKTINFLISIILPKSYLLCSWNCVYVYFNQSKYIVIVKFDIKRFSEHNCTCIYLENLLLAQIKRRQPFCQFVSSFFLNNILEYICVWSDLVFKVYQQKKVNENSVNVRPFSEQLMKYHIEIYTLFCFRII